MPRRRQTQPIRYQIRSAILDLLAEKNYKPGDKIPTEPEFMDLLDVSRSSLREGLQLLEQDGLIRTRHGSGRYLSFPTNDYHFDIARLQGASEMMMNYGIRVSTRVITLCEMPADEEIASNLDLEPGDPVAWIERVRLADEVPVIYSIDIVPRSILAGELQIGKFEGSLLKILEQEWNVYIARSRAVIRAVVSDHSIPAGVSHEPNTPWILMEQVNYDSIDRPIIYSKDYHRGDSIAFYINRNRF